MTKSNPNSLLEMLFDAHGGREEALVFAAKRCFEKALQTPGITFQQLWETAEAQEWIDYLKAQPVPTGGRAASDTAASKSSVGSSRQGVAKKILHTLATQRSALKSADIRALTGLEPKQVSGALQNLKKEGYVVAEGKYRNASWTITDGGRQAI